MSESIIAKNFSAANVIASQYKLLNAINIEIRSSKNYTANSSTQYIVLEFYGCDEGYCAMIPQYAICIPSISGSATFVAQNEANVTRAFIDWSWNSYQLRIENSGSSGSGSPLFILAEFG